MVLLSLNTLLVLGWGVFQTLHQVGPLCAIVSSAEPGGRQSPSSCFRTVWAGPRMRSATHCRLSETVLHNLVWSKKFWSSC